MVKAVLFALSLGFAVPALANHSNAESDASFDTATSSAELFRPGRRRVQCVAKSGFGRWGHRFVGRGRNRMQARRRAMMKCRRQSRAPRTCHVVRCHRGRF